MKRRKFIVLGGAAGSSISWPLSVRAQQHERVRRIGVIMGFAEDDRIDLGSAAEAPGVLSVLTGNDAAKDGLQPIPHRPVPANPYEVPLKSRDGAPFLIAPHPVLALGKTRYVGEPVALIIAETLWQAMDAAERLAVELRPATCGHAVGRRAGARGGNLPGGGVKH